jgi:outer membrane lipoprotein-sorting protein
MRKIIVAAAAVLFCFVVQASAAEFSADMKTIVMGMTSSSKIYFKAPKKQRLEMMGMIIITGEPLSYELFEDTKRYVVIDEDELKENSPMADVDDFEEYFKANDFRKVGSETVAGYSCDIYEGSIQFTKDQAATEMTLWYSPKLDYPVKTEAQLPSPMSGTSVSTLENIKIGKQPSSLFELPAGYTQAQSTQEAMGMGNSPMPSGEGSGEMPSQEEMMRMMQEMVGGQGE